MIPNLRKAGKVLVDVETTSASARNRCASELAAELGLDEVTETLLLRLTEDYVTFAVDSVVPAVETARMVAVIGGTGTGKSTLAAALWRLPTDDMPVAVAHGLALVAITSSVPTSPAPRPGIS